MGLYWFFGFCWSVIVAVLVVLVVACGGGGVPWIGQLWLRLGLLVVDLVRWFWMFCRLMVLLFGILWHSVFGGL